MAQMEMLFCSTVVGLPFLIPPMLLTGELFKAWTSCSQVRLMITLFPAYMSQSPNEIELIQIYTAASLCVRRVDI